MSNDGKMQSFRSKTDFFAEEIKFKKEQLQKKHAWLAIKKKTIDKLPASLESRETELVPT